MKFNFDWFGSSARKALKERVEQLEKENKELTEKSEASDVPSQRPYRNMYISNDNVTVVMNSGEVFTKTEVNAAFIDAIRNSSCSDQIYALFTPPKVIESTNVVIDTKEEKELVNRNLDILRDHADFEIKGSDVFLKGVSLAIPSVVVAAFIEILEKWEDHVNLISDNDEGTDQFEEQYEALKMFWYWTALNPIESSRVDLLHFVRNNDINITSNGLLEMYRRVVSTGSKDKDLVKFVSESYFKVKAQKKGTSNYWIWKAVGGDFKLLNYKPKKSSKKGHRIGCLADVYRDLPNIVENTFTDAHTHKKLIKLGEIYREDESKIDLDNTRDCSRGLHVGGPTFGFSGFGDTGVMCLVNPSKVRSVPKSETNKMRVSEMFVAAVLDIKDYQKHLDSGVVNDFSQEYFNTSVDELEKALAEKTFEPLVCQEHVPEVTIMDIQEIKNLLKQRVVQI